MRVGLSKECQPDEGVPLNECLGCDMVNAPRSNHVLSGERAFFMEAMVNYSEARAYLEQHSWRGSVYGIDTMTHLTAYLDHPDRRLQIIHIAGTNGKGSTVAHLAAILETAGYTTASYTSPEVRTYLDRFMVHRQPVEAEAFAQALTQVAQAADRMAEDGLPHPTVFEMELAAAWLLAPVGPRTVFLMETGLGGQMDATNVVKKPLLTVLTAIGMDHQALLGQTLNAIAEAKAGIIKPGVPVVSWPQAAEAAQVIRATAAANQAPLYVLDPTAVKTLGPLEGREAFSYRGEPYQTALLGLHQATNAAGALLCVEALGRLGYTISADDCRQGLLATNWPARMERLPFSRPLYLDGAHNPPAMAVLADNMDHIAPQGRWRVVLHIFKDKDAASMLALLNGRAAELIITEINTDRSMPAQDLAALAKTQAPACQVTLKPRLEEAISYIRASAQDNDYFIICGSLSHLEAARQCLLEESEML